MLVRRRSLGTQAQQAAEGRSLAKRRRMESGLALKVQPVVVPAEVLLMQLRTWLDLANDTSEDWVPSMTSDDEYIPTPRTIKTKGMVREILKERPHACSDCGKRFKTKTILRAHKRSHTGADTFVCYCGSSYRQQASLWSHKKHCGHLF